MPLQVVATPIGNLDDLSPRARAALAKADLIACEDTRRTGRLLHLVGLGGAERAELLRLDDHTEATAADRVLEELAVGRSVVLVSDAGTPTIADPGALLVRAALDAGHDVEPIPGPSAVLAALVASGLSSGRFVFEGFLPRRGADRSTRLDALAAEKRPVVFYESPNRLAATLTELVSVCGPERLVAVARELTKLHEEFFRGRLDEAVEWAAGPLKGEVVVVLSGRPPADPATDEQIVAALQAELDAGATRRDAVDAVVGDLAVPKRRVYRLAIEHGGAGAAPVDEAR